MKAANRLFLMAAAAALPALGMPVHASDLDGRVESSARRSYVFIYYLQGDDIKIESKDGAVTLTGVVSEDFHRTLAQEIVADIFGVKSVDNRLEIKGARPTANSDDWIREKVKAALRLHRSASAGTTEVNVKDGVVTLRGDAAGQAQKRLTAEYAEDVEGVREVKNEMVVAKALKETRTASQKIDDASITAQVRMALLLHRSTSALKTTVATRLGVVEVGGKARDEAGRSRVSRLVSDINGVKSVRNEMTIE
jgi:osmotically-inducible protein OsmY